MSAIQAIATLILWLFAFYLLTFGLVALIRPQMALRFLFAFAQTNAANMAEGLARLAIGIAFLILDRANGWSPWGLVVGAFLAVSAIGLLLAPRIHRQLAPRLVARVQGLMPFVGVGSLLLGLLLTILLFQAAGASVDLPRAEA